MRNRIESIINLVNPEVGRIWDLCCDHGQIGLGIQKKNPHQIIHFIDQVPSIIENLEIKLTAHIPKGKFKVKCIDARKERYENNSTIVMAGIGGTLSSQILDTIYNSNLENIQIIVCAHQDIHFLREYLSNKFNLLSETLCLDKGKFYEILELDLNLEAQNVSKIGQSMWDLTDENHYKYACSFLQYYELKCQFDKSPELNNLLNFFKHLTKTFNLPIK